MTIEASVIEPAWQSDMSIFACERFLASVGHEYGWLGGVECGRLRCVLPYTIVRKPMVRLARFRLETIAVDGALEVAEERQFLNSAVRCLKSLGSDVIIPASTNAIFRTYPDGAAAAPYGSYVADLTQSEKDLWSKVHPKNRNKIRKAEREGVRIKEGLEYWEVAHALLRDTMARSRLPFMGRDQLKRLVYGLDGNVKIFVVEHSGCIQGCLVAPFSEFSAYQMYSGRALQLPQGAKNLLHWEAMRVFRCLGVRRFDFVGVRINPESGSKHEGLMRFKQRFGGELVQGYVWKLGIHPLKTAAYSVATRLLRGGDIVDVESRRLSGGMG